jgi:hypothetical protein
MPRRFLAMVKLLASKDFDDNPWNRADSLNPGATHYERRGREFESLHGHQSNQSFIGLNFFKEPATKLIPKLFARLFSSRHRVRLSPPARLLDP